MKKLVYILPNPRFMSTRTIVVLN